MDFPEPVTKWFERIASPEPHQLFLLQMERMEKSFESVKVNFNTVRTGRASPSLLDRVEVEIRSDRQSEAKSLQQCTPPVKCTLQFYHGCIILRLTTTVLR